MTSKELLAVFREAPWSAPADAEYLLTETEPLQADDVRRLLEILTNRGLVADSPRHGLRCSVFVQLAQRVTDRQVFGIYVATLAEADPVLREALLVLLPAVNDPARHPDLCALLRTPDSALRQTVARLIGGLGSRTAFETLAEMVQEPAFEGRVEAMEALRAMGGHRAVPALASVLSVGGTGEKIRAIRHLVTPVCLSKAPGAAFAAVATALTDSAESVRCEAISAIATHASEDEVFLHLAPVFGDPSAAVVSTAIKGLSRFDSERALAALREALQRGPNPVRFAALEVLEARPSERAVTLLTDTLGHRQVVVRIRASAALGRLARAQKIELARTVLWLLRSRDVNVRRMAIELAASVPDPTGSLWPKLLEYLYDEDWWVRERVLDTVVDMAGMQLVPHLIAHLQDDKDPLRRYYAVAMLTRLKAPQAVAALARAAASDPDWLLRERAIEALGALKDENTVPLLLDIMAQCPNERLACIQALQETGSPRAAGPVAALLATPGIEVDERVAVLRCLKAIEGKSEVATIRQHLTDPSPAVRHIASQILREWEVVAPPAAGSNAGLSILDQLLVYMAQWQADDLILNAGQPPFIKRVGRIYQVSKNVLSREQIEACLSPLLSSNQLEELEALRDVDFSCERAESGLRFRVNVFQQLGGFSAVFRLVRRTSPRLQDLGLPPAVAGFADLKNGLVLVGGPTGSGKSTTLGALIEHINETSARHVVTFEDPIEVVHPRQRSLINQREVGTHTRALHDSLRATLRQDPDVILVGELRDYETISFAVTAAETGHLVFGTVHTVSAATTVDRLINTCPPAQHEHMRTLLAGSLRAVACQYLHKGTSGRVLSVEVMINNEAIANLIRKGKAFQIPSVIATARAEGMQLMDSELMRLYQEGQISAEDAYMRAVGKKDFEKVLATPPPTSSAGKGA